MRNLDETDLKILSMLAENARRPFSEIGDEVDLSGPAVSDRVTRLQEAGIINHFTIDVDRSQLRAGLPVLIQVELPSGSHEAARDRVRDSDVVNHEPREIVDGTRTPGECSCSGRGRDCDEPATRLGYG